MSFGRITNSYLSKTLLNSVLNNQSEYLNMNLQYNSQKKFQTLSDDPMSINKLLTAKNEISKIENYNKNIDLNIAELKTAEATLGSVKTKIDRVVDLVLGASNEINQDSLDVVANDMEEQLKGIIDLANTVYNDKYIFSGANINLVTYSQDGGEYTYQGSKAADGLDIMFQASNSTVLSINETGDNIFGEYYTDASGNIVSSGAIGHIKEVIADIRATPPDFDKIREKIDVLKKDAENVTYYRTKYGTSISTLDSTKAQLGDQKINEENIRSTIEDADLIDLASRMQYQELALQASMMSTTKIMANSLLNFFSS